MGLDMRVYTKESAESSEVNEILYFRKFSALHSWLQKYAGIENCDEFNGYELEIDTNLLASLAIACVLGQLQNKSYFFWGNPRSDEEIREGVKTFLEVCQAALADGKQVYYSGDF